MSDLADFSLADAWETIADVVGDAPALYHQDIVRTWAEFEERSARLASVLLAHGIGHDSKVAHYLYNGPEYLEATFASFKVRAVPVNVNYRYTDAELSYLLDNSDAQAVVNYHIGSFKHLNRPHCKQFGVTWTSPNQIDFTIRHIFLATPFQSLLHPA